MDKWYRKQKTTDLVRNIKDYIQLVEKCYGNTGPKEWVDLILKQKVTASPMSVVPEYPEVQLFVKRTNHQNWQSMPGKIYSKL